jgi:hypothetical protein
MITERFVRSQINFAAADYKFWLVNKRPYFFITYADSAKEAEQIKKQIISFEGLYVILSKDENSRSERYMVHASPKGDILMDWYEANKGVNFPANRGKK